MRISIPALILAGVLLSGCATTKPVARTPGPADEEAWELRKSWLETLDRWTLDGRTAIAAYDEGWNASILWRQRGTLLDVNLSGPLGFGSARVTGTPEVLTVETSDGETFVTTDPESDLYWQLGWTAPLDRMRYWVLGLPGPGPVTSMKLDGAGRITELKQGRWTVDFTDFIEVQALDGRNRVLPRKLTMSRENVRIRLVVSEWTLEDPAVGSED